jgi:hypothetical protein
MFKRFMASFGIISALAGLVTVAVPVPAHAAQGCPEYPFLTFPAWHRGLPKDAAQGCSIKLNNPRLTDLWVIAFNIVEMMIQALAFFALGYIMWGGFKYIKSQGEPAKLAAAKKTILDAMLGLGVALMSVAIVRFVQGLFS